MDAVKRKTRAAKKFAREVASLAKAAHSRIVEDGMNGGYYVDLIYDAFEEAYDVYCRDRTNGIVDEWRKNGGR